MEITTGELSTIRAIAVKTASKWRLVEVDDIQSSLTLWCFENYKHLERYRSDDEGPIKLFIALRREANRIATAETAERSGKPLDYHAKYSLPQIERTLTAMFHANPTLAVNVDPHTGEPIISNDGFVDDARAMITDVRNAFSKIDEDLQQILVMRYESGLTFRDIALLQQISPPGVRKRVKKALRKIQSRL